MNDDGTNLVGSGGGGERRSRWAAPSSSSRVEDVSSQQRRDEVVVVGGGRRGYDTMNSNDGGADVFEKIRLHIHMNIEKCCVDNYLSPQYCLM